MDTCTLLFLLLFAVKALSQGQPNLLRIDCGADLSYMDTYGSYWQADENYIQTGTNEQVSNNSLLKLEQLNNLRAFTKQNKNCYILPTPTRTKYFIRATFYYGNYDHLSRPPTFKLEFDGNKWATVAVNLAYPLQFNELIYTAKRDNVTVCLTRTLDKQFPFISTLEIWPLDDGMYDGMTEDVAWLSSYRYNYGAGSDQDAENWIIGFPTDLYNRVWKPYNPQGTTAVKSYVSGFYPTCVNLPPDIAISQAIEANDPLDAIDLSFPLNKASNRNYVAAYFTEISASVNDSRFIDFYHDDTYMGTLTPEYGKCTGVWAIIQSNDTMNIQLRQNASSALPPVISAIEVYTASDPLATSTTSQDDLNGLQVLIDGFKQLNGWSGDPCLPNDTVWQWLGCNGSDPPRVSKIDLSGYGLDGPLPDFSQMQALEIINLGNNSLNGQIPSFLGTLPNLKQLDLQDNNFSGKIPKSITKNKKITYNVKGNPYLDYPKKKNLALIIGLCVGLPVGLTLVIASVFLLAQRKPPPPTQGQVTLADLSRLQNGRLQANHPEQSASFGTQTPIRPSQDNQQTEPTANKENTAASVLSSSTSQQNQGNGHATTPMSTNSVTNADNFSLFQGVDSDEIDQLLDLHIRSQRG